MAAGGSWGLGGSRLCLQPASESPRQPLQGSSWTITEKAALSPASQEWGALKDGGCAPLHVEGSLSSLEVDQGKDHRGSKHHHPHPLTPARPPHPREGRSPREQGALTLLQGKELRRTLGHLSKGRNKLPLPARGLGAINISYPEKAVAFCWMASISSRASFSC